MFPTSVKTKYTGLEYEAALTKAQTNKNIFKTAKQIKLLTIL